MSSSQFAVVEFLEDRNIEVVPVYFLLEENKKCFWPKKAGPNISKILSKNEPIQDSKKFDIYDVKVLYFGGKYVHYFEFTNYK
jgi:hypothetical protein